jgi:SAM-dependent methyltransferase
LNDPVGRYYDENTPRFLRLGGSGEVAAIHRQVWGPGVHSKVDSFRYVNELIKEQMTRLLPPSSSETCLLDLGCGAGGTATWLAQEMGVNVVGVSNSPVQVGLAEARARKYGISGKCQFVVGDFHVLDAVDTGCTQGRFDGAYAIESFAHSIDPARFFQEVSKKLNPESLLVLVDDFMSSASLPHEAFPWLKLLKDGWHLNSLMTLDELVKLATGTGFRLQELEDLTKYLRPLPALRLALMKWIAKIPLHTAYWQNLSGGAALQVCIAHEWTTYNILSFVRCQ